MGDTFSAGVEDMIPKDFRNLVRKGQWNKPTSGVCKGYAQANLAILPKSVASDFLLFCVRNLKPCPVLDVIEAGMVHPAIGQDSDIRTDLPRYKVFHHGELVEEPENLLGVWREDFVSFLLGCSFSFETALMAAGIRIKHIDLDLRCPVYSTNIPCRPAGIFQGNMAVSMRPIPKRSVTKVIQITSRYPFVHGAPVHFGNPQEIGITDIEKPDFGDAVPFDPDEVPVFWACGVTPQLVAMKTRPEVMITHYPTYMYVSDLLNEELAAL
jgi:uncharacterized protein YcsI (UPF0317 family)